MDRKQKIGARLKLARNELGWSQRDLAKLYGSSDVTISEIERGITDISVPELETFSRLLGKPFAWFLSDKLEIAPRPVEAILSELRQAAQRIEFRELPVLGRVPCGFPLPAEQQAEGHFPVLKSELGYARDKAGLFVLEASGESLSGDGIHTGAKMVVDPTPPDFQEGKIYAVRLGTEVTAKHVYKLNGSVKLVSSNGAYKEIIKKAEEVEILGRVILWGDWHKA
jgi:SOS-response transcriptional repressor LexA